MAKRVEWEVVVGNIGAVLHGKVTDEAAARRAYRSYVDDSQRVPGCRCYGEDVTLLRDGEIVEEYIGHLHGSGS